MIITLTSFKGGVGKTTSAVHIATYLQRIAPTLLVDGDPNRSATRWAEQGGLECKVIDERLLAKHVARYEHVVIDTQAHPDEEDLKVLAEGCDLLILPTTPDALALDALLRTVEALHKLGSSDYKALITRKPPKPSRDGQEARQMLQDAGLPVFRHCISNLVAFQKAALAGVPVYRSGDPRGRVGWLDYEAIGKEIQEYERK